MMTFTDAVKKAFRQYAVFSRRATRAEFWWWVLFLTIGSIGLALIEAAIQFATGTELGILSLLFAFGTILPSLAVTCRRLHDIGKSGWWQLAWHTLPVLAWVAAFASLFMGTAVGIGIGDNRDYPPVLDMLSILPFIISLVVATATSLGTIIWAVIWTVRPSQPGPNRYGPQPLHATPAPVPES